MGNKFESEGIYFQQRFIKFNIFKDGEIGMWLVSLQTIRSVEINYIFSLIPRCYGLKKDILDFGEQSYVVYYPILSYQKIKVHRVETMDMGRFHWNNSVSETDLVYISTMVLIVIYKILS